MPTPHHGVSTHETTKLSTLIPDIDTSIIGVACTAEDADSAHFPYDIPVLLERPMDALSAAGTTGSLYTTLKAISDQCSTNVVVVRVRAVGNTDAAGKTQEQLTLGGVDADGHYTGLYAFLTAEVRLGVRVRILAAPGLETKAVAVQLGVIAEKMKAFAYVGATGCRTISEAKTYRSGIASRELMVIYPDVIAYDTHKGKPEVMPVAAYAVGLRARIDAEQGWHKSISNVPMKGVLGVSLPIYWSLQGTDTDADSLNNNQISTLIKREGFCIWGNRTCDTEEYTFEVYTRTAQFLRETIAEAHAGYNDKPMTPSLVKDIIDGINRKGSQLVTQGRLLGFHCWYDPNDNPKENLREGMAHIRYKYTPVPPLENLTLTQTFTDEYFEPAFAALA